MPTQSTVSHEAHSMACLTWNSRLWHRSVIRSKGDNTKTSCNYL